MYLNCANETDTRGKKMKHAHCATMTVAIISQTVPRATKYWGDMAG